jgi:hypothetical protein
MNRRFAWGVNLIVVSVFIGVAYKFYVLARLAGTTSFHWLDIHTYFSDATLATATIWYLLSWPMFFFGLFLCGKEGLAVAERFTKYVTYRYYHRKATEHMPRLAKQSVRNTKLLVEQGRKKTAVLLKRHGIIEGHRPRRKSKKVI